MTKAKEAGGRTSKTKTRKPELEANNGGKTTPANVQSMHAPGADRAGERDQDAEEVTKAHFAGPDGADAPGVPFPIVGVCASAGGLEAFQDFLKALPEDTGAAYILVQHMDPHHRSTLPEILAKSTRLPVQEVADGLGLEPDNIYIGTANTLVGLDRATIRLEEPTKAEHRYRALDWFLGSLAEAAQERAIAVVLSGTGSDATLGLQVIKEHGGITFAQEAGSARYAAMPMNAVRAGHADFQGKSAEIAQEIKRITRNPMLVPREPEPDVHEDAGGLAQIFSILRATTRVDFSSYKRATVQRRIMRRMVLRHADDVAAYVKILREDADEVSALYNDLLIKVTQFFRDGESFEALEKALETALKARKDDGPFRVWIPGCATGQEAYTVAMILLDLKGRLEKDMPIQVFGTDLSEEAIGRAREARYDACVEVDVPERIRSRFFEKVDGGFRVTKQVREACIFSVHNVIHDPPFSRIDLITCRNLLIYLRGAQQEQVLAAFHYGLTDEGILMLGGSETTGPLSGLFDVIDARHRLYQRRAGARRLHHTVQPGRLAVDAAKPGDFARPAPAPEPNIRLLADQYVLRHHAPPGVVVNDNMDILQFRGNTGRFLAPPQGDASLNLIRMARPGLDVELRAAMQGARRQKKAFTRKGIRFLDDDDWTHIEITVAPVSTEEAGPARYIVLFDEVPEPLGRELSDDDAHLVPKAYAEEEINRLREQLLDTRGHLQSALEETETANEELRTANEEAVSSNEELQSTNEELQTAMEELQSTNEELTTVNEELQNRNQELDRLNNDLENLLASAELPIVFVGDDLRIRRFTPQAEKLLHLSPGDVGRWVSDLQPRINIEDLRDQIEQVVEDVRPRSQRVEGEDGRWYELRITPYKTADGRIDGALVMMLDINTMVRRLDEVSALLETSTSIAEAGSFDEAVTSSIEAICRRLGWLGGEAWMVGDTRDHLRRTHAWAAEPKRMQALLAAGEALTFGIGEGVPGKAWDGHAPVVLDSITDASSGFKRHAIAQQVGATGAVAVPIQVGNETQMVLLFFVPAKETMESRADIAGAVAAQFGSVFAQKLAQEEAAMKARQLAIANEELARFTAVLAHDVSNPVRSARLFLDMLEHVKGDDKKNLGRARDTLDHLSAMLQHLLRFTRSEDVVSKPEHIEIAEAVKTAVDALATTREERGGKIECRSDLEVEVDRVVLTYALTNAMDNALKYSGDQPANVAVEARARAGFVDVAVKDDGPGMDAETLATLFRWTADAQAERHMGLALTRHLVRRIGGDFTVACPEEGGTVVTICLPLGPRPATTD